ncbi:skin secretory protein xP2-like [Panicum virgatum]|uniref:skin secretory protein xP2-like n=1 Tax=Panicum virgatum TaxID=38727 RepID=UPI0019D65E04|nr:skin secretory protein xP2-like [Panicum virgatum]
MREVAEEEEGWGGKPLAPVASPPQQVLLCCSPAHTPLAAPARVLRTAGKGPPATGSPPPACSASCRAAVPLLHGLLLRSPASPRTPLAPDPRRSAPPPRVTARPRLAGVLPGPLVGRLAPAEDLRAHRGLLCPRHPPARRSSAHLVPTPTPARRTASACPPRPLVCARSPAAPLPRVREQLCPRHPPACRWPAGGSLRAAPPPPLPVQPLVHARRSASASDRARRVASGAPARAEHRVGGEALPEGGAGGEEAARIRSRGESPPEGGAGGEEAARIKSRGESPPEGGVAASQIR